MVEIYRFRDKILGDGVPLVLALFLFFIASYLTPPPAGDYTGSPVPGIFAWVFFAVTVSYTVLGNYAIGSEEETDGPRARAFVALPTVISIATFLAAGVTALVIDPLATPPLLLGMLAGIVGMWANADWHHQDQAVHIDWWGGMVTTWILFAVLWGIFFAVAVTQFGWSVHSMQPQALLFAAPTFMFLTIVIADWLASREAKSHHGPVVLGYFGGTDALFAVYAVMALAFVGGLYFVLGGGFA